METIEFVVSYECQEERCLPGDMIDIISHEVKHDHISCMGANLTEFTIPLGVAVIRSHDDKIVYAPKGDTNDPERYELIA